jgi:hypothetical protein
VDANRLLKRGFRTELDDWSRLDAFVAIYRETMVHCGAPDAYHFDAQYFNALRACLGERLHLCMVLGPGGEDVAGGLFTRVGGIMQFHLAGTAQAWRRDGPAKLMLLDMRDHARACGVRSLHLGGGVGCAEDSLAFFKQGFSHLRATFRTFRMVLLPQVYRELAGEASPACAFFPAYRRP